MNREEAPANWRLIAFDGVSENSSEGATPYLVLESHWINYAQENDHFIAFATHSGFWRHFSFDYGVFSPIILAGLFVNK
jgi:hypothetical protein